eukprot:GHUV01040007.1.p1 GENE.GHUV01040007.1~~GHUV01040007.1.p1  ORF type:complete len:130 (+),score=14.94 GHUV01040007.1:193-582(+)
MGNQLAPAAKQGGPLETGELLNVVVKEALGAPMSSERISDSHTRRQASSNETLCDVCRRQQVPQVTAVPARQWGAGGGQGNTVSIYRACRMQIYAQLQKLSRCRCSTNARTQVRWSPTNSNCRQSGTSH